MCNGVQSATEASVGQRTGPGVFPEAAVSKGPAPDPAQETQVLSGITDAQSRGRGVETELTPGWKLEHTHSGSLSLRG